MLPIQTPKARFSVWGLGGLNGVTRRQQPGRWTMRKGRDICARSQGSNNKELRGLGEQVEGITECMELWTK